MLNQVLCYAYLNQVVLRFRPSEFLDQFFYLDQSSIFDHFLWFSACWIIFDK